MKKSFYLTLFLCSLSLFTVKGVESEITLETQTGTLYGTLLSSDTNPSKDAVVLFICGSGPTDRDGNNPQMKNNSIQFLAKDLCKAGIPSVRYDKRGIAASAKASISESDLRFNHYVKDVREWITFLARNYKRVILVGHSEGALIGTMAAEENPKVKALILIAGVAHPADEILKSQLAAQPKGVTDVAFPIIDSLKKGVLVKDVPAMLHPLFRQSVQPYLISWFAIDPVVEIAKIRIPLLIVQGDQDMQVGVEEARLLHQAVSKSQLKIIPQMNHVFKKCNSMSQVAQIPLYTNPSLQNVPELAHVIVDFIQTLKK